MSEPIVLRARHGAQTEGTAVITRWSGLTRAARAIAIAVAGLLIGMASIIVPGLHLVSTWLIPLLSLGIAWYVLQIRSRIERVEGLCPSCGASVAAGPFGAAADDEPLWVRCPSCTIPLEVQWAP